ncbi:predicted protein [Botrytis cinerea T4]|uniref:Uncharacterized protein n=1 Tax=Botryotinia fuckeliana (strain T4) TaxID=999810 RepID=G2YP74_BOTF4|nr:predicted protein [Botrytis cinerea T4]
MCNIESRILYAPGSFSVNAELSTITDQLLHPQNKPESLANAPCRFRAGGHWTIQCRVGDKTR